MSIGMKITLLAVNATVSGVLVTVIEPHSQFIAHGIQFFAGAICAAILSQPTHPASPEHNRPPM